MKITSFERFFFIQKFLLRFCKTVTISVKKLFEFCAKFFNSKYIFHGNIEKGLVCVNPEKGITKW